MIRLTVPGVPQQKGSTRTFMHKGRPIVTSDNPKLKGWERAVAAVAKVAAAQPFFSKLTPPVTMHVEFRMPLTKALQRRLVKAPSTDVAHISKPDIDKLVRGVCDPLSGLLYEDDRQIAMVTASKRYCRIGEEPGATITLCASSALAAGDVAP